MESFRRNAVTLHQAITDYIHCSNHVRHNVNVHLEDPNFSFIRDEKHKKSEAEFQFKLLFIAHNPMPQNEQQDLELQSVAREAYVCVEEDEAGSDSIVGTKCGTETPRYEPLEILNDIVYRFD